jgi:hypothetical protein
LLLDVELEPLLVAAHDRLAARIAKRRHQILAGVTERRALQPAAGSHGDEAEHDRDQRDRHHDLDQREASCGAVAGHREHESEGPRRSSCARAPARGAPHVEPRSIPTVDVLVEAVAAVLAVGAERGQVVVAVLAGLLVYEP